ncbi:hypothetical protein [Streptosporangium sp. NPDC002524]|uniref:hypothetical protein n=1 Tax=Streptosporangium sp. NPDC002524 TaxID=3154537 RepID=UPI0033299763
MGNKNRKGSMRRERSASPPPVGSDGTSGQDLRQGTETGEDPKDRGNKGDGADKNEGIVTRPRNDPPANDGEEPEELRRTRRQSIDKFGGHPASTAPPPAVRLGWRPAQGRMTYWIMDDSGMVGAKKESPGGTPRVMYTPAHDRPMHVDGQLVVRAEPSYTADPPIFVRRADLVDNGYQETVDAIEELVRRNKVHLRAFWLGKRQELDAMTEITLEQPVSGLKASAYDSARVTDGSLVTVPAGTHILAKTRSSAFGFPGGLAPFSAIVEVDVEGVVQEVLIPGELVWGSDQSHAEEAREQGVAQEITAERIMEVLVGDEYFARYLAGRRLTGDRLHYVTPEEMGAVFVLDRMPGEEGEIEIARTANEYLFNAGLSTPGLSVGGHIFVQRDQLGTGTEYHETIHWFSDPTVEQVLGHWFNEGLTEYLTRYPVDALGAEVFRNQDQYGPQRQAIEKLVRHAGISDEQLCEAYFKGEIQPLYEAVAAATEGTFSLDAFAACLDPARAGEALRHFDLVFVVPDEAQEDAQEEAQEHEAEAEAG